MKPLERIERFAGLKAMGCIACLTHGHGLFCGYAHIHHLNLGGRAGQKRLGDEHTLPLGPWHHVGQPPDGLTATQATKVYGPSLARASKDFRRKYGSDSELLAQVNARLAQMVMT